jgi:hypothetical protein
VATALFGNSGEHISQQSFTNRKTHLSGSRKPSGLLSFAAKGRSIRFSTLNSLDVRAADLRG